MKNIPLSKPTFDLKTIWELIKVLKSGWVGNGPKVLEFEKKFAEYVGAKYAIAVNSATSGLDLCLKAYGINGGELITTPLTFVADASVGEFNNMDVTFADVDKNTLCLDPKSLKVTKKTKAIIAVDSHGRLADIKGIRKSCGRFKPLIIEDAAHAMWTPGAGTGDITVYSFQAVKTLPIFDGGMITTNDENIAKKLKSLYWLGVEKSTFDRVTSKGYQWEYDIKQPGIKGYMTDVQAILGIGQLRRLEKMNKKRREIQKAYNEAFKGYAWFQAPQYSHTVQYYTARFADRDGLCEHLSNKGIATSVHFKPLHWLTYWKKGEKRRMPVADSVWKELLSLPVHDNLSKKQIKYIIRSVIEFYEKK